MEAKALCRTAAQILDFVEIPGLLRKVKRAANIQSTGQSVDDLLVDLQD